MVTERLGFWLVVQDSITLILAMIPPHGQLRCTGRARGSDAVRVGGMETRYREEVRAFLCSGRPEQAQARDPSARTYIQELYDALETQARFERRIVRACRPVSGP
jgi:hypothetical protein